MIETNQLTFAYKKQSPLFKPLSLNETPGKIIGLLGKNGAGKTTLLELLAGLLTPATGAISVLGHTPSYRNPNFLSRVYYVPEEFYLPSISIAGYVKANAPFYPTFDPQKMDNLLAEFELLPAQNLTKISHGQKKKFRIAFALATNCSVIILDEPTNGLDIPSKAIFRKVMASSLAENQLAIISTHQVKDIETLIDKIIMLDQGAVVLNQNVLDITDRYEFCISATIPENAIYSEFSISGYKVILPSTGAPTDIDMELLFNALTNGAMLN